MSTGTDYDQEAHRVGLAFPSAPRLGILGSHTFHDSANEPLCERIGTVLARMGDVVLVTGGVAGVGETIGRSFFHAQVASGREPRVFHVLPRGHEPWDYGTTLTAGADMRERREILARLCPLYVTVEGGPGTAHEIRVATQNGAGVLPVGRSGGASGELYRRRTSPSSALVGDWDLLGDPTASRPAVAEAVLRLIEHSMRGGSTP
jgi:hypothetical protein